MNMSQASRTSYQTPKLYSGFMASDFGEGRTEHTISPESVVVIVRPAAAPTAQEAIVEVLNLPFLPT